MLNFSCRFSTCNYAQDPAKAVVCTRMLLPWLKATEGVLSPKWCSPSQCGLEKTSNTPDLAGGG